MKRWAGFLLLALGISAAVYRLVLTRIIMAPGPQMSEVFVAAHKLEIGAVVRETDLKPAYWAGPLPRDMALKKEGVVGRGVVSVIYEGEPILDSRLAPSGPLQ